MIKNIRNFIFDSDMNLILIFKEDFIDEGRRVCLTGRRHEHVLKIHRASIGDRLAVGLYGGGIGVGKIVELDENTLIMDVIFDRKVPGALPLTLVMALPRPIVLKRVLSTVSAFGVKRIVLFHARRVEKSFWKSPALREENLTHQLILGLEQARDTILPKVEMRTAFKPFVEDELPGIIGGTRAFVAHPESKRKCPYNVDHPVTLVIGPEGGFIPYEIEKLQKAGCIPVSLGERILRVESVIPALLSRIF